MPPFKKVPETDAIFDNVKQVHEEAAQSDTTLRVSLDAKATVVIGPFSRGGHTRVGTQAADHDFKPEGHLTPFGIFLPDHDDLSLYFTPSKVTSDFIVDMLTEWWQRVRTGFAHIRTLVLDLDNGPENSGSRSQFLKRLVDFACLFGLTLRLVYYPPYHSKYNPIERCWGVLENYWRSELLDSVAAVLGYASKMTYNGNHPHVYLNEQPYCKGVRLTRPERRELEKNLERTTDLKKWSITIEPSPKPDQLIT